MKAKLDVVMTKRFNLSKKVGNLDELKKKIPVFGNAYHDMPIFQATDRLFLASKNAIERKEILDFVSNEVMGIKHHHTNSDVKDYLKLLREEKEEI